MTTNRHIHQIWLGKKSPKYLDLVVYSRKNWPSFEFQLWTDRDANVFKNDSYFDGSLSETFLWKYASNNAVRADIFRYLILEKFGGIYIDFDFQFRQDPIDKFTDAKLILAAEGHCPERLNPVHK